MADKAWKQLERDAAALIPDGKRYWSNSGERLDIEGKDFVGQCKLVQRMSLASLTSLALEVSEGRKFGFVVTKLRAGKGNKTPILVTMTADEFALLMTEHPLFVKAKKTNDQAAQAAPVPSGPGLPGGEASDPVYQVGGDCVAPTEC